MLNLYREVSPGSYEMFDDDNPLTTVHNGRDGGSYELKLFVRANDLHDYTNISVLPDDGAGGLQDIAGPGNPGNTPGTSGWGIKLLADPGYTPSKAEWDAADFGGQLP